MARVIRRLARLLPALAALTLPSLQSVAAAQASSLTPQIDLDGVWELDEHGARRDGSAKPLVRIKRTNMMVAAVFISGAECFDGSVRQYLFVGDLKLDPVLNPPWLLSSTHMLVCSGTPSLRETCRGSIPTNYETSFTAAKVTSTTITGDRVARGYKDCTPNKAFDEPVSFTLTRATCGEEAQTAALREAAFRNLMTSIVDARGVFIVAIDAARSRFGDTYRGRPVEDLRYPVTATNLTDLVEYEAFAFATPDIFEATEWTKARLMASEMGVAESPALPEAARMLEELYRIEAAASNLKRAHRDMLDARDALAACRKQPQ